MREGRNRSQRFYQSSRVKVILVGEIMIFNHRIIALEYQVGKGSPRPTFHGKSAVQT